MAKTFAQLGFGHEFSWMDLYNSLELDGFGMPTDHLERPVWIADWLRHWNLAKTVPRPVPCGELRKLRALLRRIGDSLLGNKSISPRDLSALNAVLKVPATEQLIQRQNGWSVATVPVRRGWEWILAQVARSLVEMLQRGRPGHLKVCPNQGCLWIFYDQTKGNTRRWCNDRTCGNRDRVRRARAGIKTRARDKNAETKVG